MARRRIANPTTEVEEGIRFRWSNFLCLFIESQLRFQKVLMLYRALTQLRLLQRTRVPQRMLIGLIFILRVSSNFRPINNPNS